MGFSSYIKAKDLLSNKFEVTSKQMVKEINRGIDNHFETFFHPIEMLSNNINFTDVDSAADRIDYAKDFLKNVKDSDEDVFSAYYGTEDGRFIIYPEGDMGEHFNHKERPWYKMALEKKGQVVVSNPFKDARTGKLVVSVCKTVEKNNSIIGVVGMDISLENMSKSLSEVKIGNEGYVFITDATGIIISHADSKQCKEIKWCFS